MDNQTHISKLWWILPGQLAGMPKPQVEDLAAVRDVGIRAIISLLEDQDGLAGYEANGFESLWLAVEDDEAPTREQVGEVVEFVDLHIGRNNPVAIHCKGGRGRTGTMLAAYLIAKGASYAEAMTQIEAVQPNAIRKDAQIDFLKELGSGSL